MIAQMQHRADSGGGGGGPTLVDLLIDSQRDWRQLIGEANPQEPLGRHLSESQIKRQEIIHELIQTERHHCLTLALMRQVYLSGLLRLNELRQRNACGPGGTTGSGQHQQHHGISTTGQSATQDTPPQRSLLGEPIDIERLFPALEELIQAHELFFAHLRLRLVECCSLRSPRTVHQPLVGIIGPLGDLLIEQFRLTRQDTNDHQQGTNSAPARANITSTRRHHHQHHKRKQTVQQQRQQQNTNGYKLLQAYAKFCGQHYESSRYFKQLLQFDKGFRQFIEQCNKQHAACRQRGIPECNLLVAQRLTKYPLLIEQLIKTSKDEPNDEEAKLRRALVECRALLAELNSQLARKESFERLLDIYAQFSPKSHTLRWHKSALRPFTKHDLLQHKRLRQLMHADDQVRIWSASRRKLFPVLCLVLNDIVVFLRVDAQQHQQQSQQVAGAVTGSQQQQQHQQRHLEAGLCSASAANLRFIGQDEPALQTDGHHSETALLTAAAAATNSSHNLTTSTTATTIAQLNQQPPPTPAPPVVRYYFANIDNKSSVISLGKLLVREKAVEEPEPRVYLISSSPRQPEMYELAFISRRHQSTFTQKLKAAAEAHNRTRLSLAATTAAAQRLGDRSSCSRRASAPQTLELAGPLSDSECCSLTASDCSGGSSRSGSSSSRTGSGSTCGSSSSASSSSCCDASSLSRCASDAEDYDAAGVDPQQRHHRAPGGTETGASGQAAKLVVDLEDLELDIEQELVPAPSCLDHEAEAEAEAEAEEEEESKFAGPRAESATPSCLTTTTSTAGADAEATTGGLSERARDSCDDLSSPRLWALTAAAGDLDHHHQASGSAGGCQRRQKARANRKRRLQRPRQASNQSTDSGATSGTSLTSGIGSGDLDSAGNGPGTGSCHHQLAGSCRSSLSGRSRAEQLKDSAPATGTSTPPGAPAHQEEDLDSGRGHDDCSSSSSSSSCPDDSLDGQRGPAGDTAPVKPPPEVGADLAQPPRVAPDPAPAAFSLAPAQTQLPPPQAAKHAPKQRKLSTVSNISSCQIKLLQRLRSVGLLTTTTPTSANAPGQGASQIDNNNHRPQPPPLGPVCANCICHQQQQQQQESAGTLSKRHVRSQHGSKRRSLFVPEQKLEELRNLRIQLDKDKQEWQEKFDRMQEQLLNERHELDMARERLKLERTQIENEREQLFRQLDILKQNGILLSPSHRIVITSSARSNSSMQLGAGGQMPQQRHLQQQQQQQQQQFPPQLYASNFANSYHHQH